MRPKQIKVSAVLSCSCGRIKMETKQPNSQACAISGHVCKIPYGEKCLLHDGEGNEMLSRMSHSGLNARCKTSFVTQVCVCARVTTRLHKRPVNDVRAANTTPTVVRAGMRTGA